MRAYTHLTTAFLLLLSLFAVPAKAQFGGFPGLDPSSIFGKGKDFARKQLLKELAKRLGQDAPTVSSADATFPTVPELPGQTFQPAGNTQSALSQLAKTTNGSIMLPPGDYEFKVRCNCMKHSAHSPSGHLYLLAPIKGKRAAMITTLNARAAAASVPSWQVQHMSWDLQAGLRYEQLPSNEQAIADQYLSDYKRDLAGSQLDQIKDTYNKYGPKAGFGSFDSALAGGELGDVGKSIIELENFQSQLASANTQAGVNSLIPRTQSDATGGPENTPWSRINDRVYGRMYTAGGYQSVGALQIRVSPDTGAAADTTNSSVNVPITSLEGEPQNDNIQPLSMVVLISDADAAELPASSPQLSVDDIRKRIANYAKSLKGSNLWDYSQSRPPFGPSTEKCNLFVYEVSGWAQANVPLINGGRLYNWFGIGSKQFPVLAGQWANPTFDIPGWEVVPTPQPGDIIAEAHQYRDATGHSGIVVTDDNGNLATASASAADNPPGIITVSSWGFRPGQHPVFRRYVGIP